MNVGKRLPSIVQSDANGHTIRIPRKRASLVMGGIILLLVGSMGFGIWGIARQAEVLQLRQETELQKEQLKLLQKKIDVLDKKMEVLDTLEQEVRTTIKGAESGTIVKDAAKEQQKDQTSTTGGKIEDSTSSSSNEVNVKKINATELSAAISRLDRLAQKRLSTFYMLSGILKDGLGTDIKNLQAMLLTMGNGATANSTVPSIWPAKGTISSIFGVRIDPVYGGGAVHEGLDIANDIGTNVMATAAGIVTFAGYDGGYGNLVEIDHGNGFVTRYGHNSVLLVSTGMTVQQGQSIALMGSTGKSTGPHLHYEVRVNGVPTDPILFLPIQ